MSKFDFDTVKKDYIHLMDTFGAPYDMTGGFVDAERMETVIRSPSKRNAARYMIDVIQYGFSFGECWRIEGTNSSTYKHDIPIASDPFLQEMFEKYML